MRKILFLAVIAVLLSVCSFAEAAVHVEGRYWFTSLDSKLQHTDAGLAGSKIDMAGDLGIGDTENFWEARLSLESGNHRFIYGYMPLSWDAEKTLIRSINFGGAAYAAGALVKSTIDMVYQRAGYRYNSIDAMGNQFEFILDVKVINVDAKLKAPSIEKSYSKTTFLPTIGLGVQIGLPFSLSFGAEGTGMGYGGSHVIDGEAYVSFHAIPFTTISAGYRIFEMKISDESEDKADIQIKGPFLMVRAGF